MDYSLGQMSSDKRVLVREYKIGLSGPLYEKTLALADLAQAASNLPHLLYFEQNNVDDEFHEFVEEFSAAFPIVERSIPDFSSLDEENARELLSETYSRWTLQNNLETIENLIPLLKRLKGLFPNERGLFFEELWHIFRLNLGCTRLKIIYNDLRVLANEKNILVPMVCEGQNHTPELREAQVPEQNMLTLFSPQCVYPFQIKEYSEEKRELFILASINKGPILVMANLSQNLTRLQKGLLKTLFDGLQMP